MVYHPDLGGEADAENKLLFFHPPTTPLAEQVRCVGLSEALCNFASSLAPGTPCESMHTQNRRYVFEQVEPRIWLVLIVQHGEGDAPEEADQTAGEAEEEMQDAHLKAVLQRLYGTLRFFCGPLLPVLEAQGAPALRTLLGGFLSRLLALMLGPTASAASAASASDAPPPRGALSAAADLLDAMDGIRFLPVEQRLYLRTPPPLTPNTATLNP